MKPILKPTILRKDLEAMPKSRLVKVIRDMDSYHAAMPKPTTNCRGEGRQKRRNATSHKPGSTKQPRLFRISRQSNQKERSSCQNQSEVRQVGINRGIDAATHSIVGDTDRASAGRIGSQTHEGEAGSGIRSGTQLTAIRSERSFASSMNQVEERSEGLGKPTRKE